MIIEREKEIKRNRTKIDQKKYGQARRRKNTPYDQAGSVLTVMLTGYELTKPGLWAAKVLWHSGFRGLFEEGEMDVVHPHSPSDRGKEDVAALMRWGRFERESVDQLEDLMKIAARGGQAQAAFTDAGRGP